MNHIDPKVTERGHAIHLLGEVEALEQELTHCKEIMRMQADRISELTIKKAPSGSET